MSWAVGWTQENRDCLPPIGPGGEVFDLVDWAVMEGLSVRVEGDQTLGAVSRLAASVSQADQCSPSRSMRVNAKLIRVINSATPWRAPTQV